MRKRQFVYRLTIQDKFGCEYFAKDYGLFSTDQKASQAGHRIFAAMLGEGVGDGSFMEITVEEVK